MQKIHAQPEITWRHVNAGQSNKFIQACGASRGIKVQREVFVGAVDTTDRLDGVLEKFKLSKAINICAWISRFLYNSRHPDQKLSGPLTTEEIRKQHIFWVKRAQKSCDLHDDYLQLACT